MADSPSLTLPYGAVAQSYYEHGWAPIPLPYKEKSPVPDNTTGANAPYVTEAQVARWLGWRSGQFRKGLRGRPEYAVAGNLKFPPGNVAFRLPPNVIGIDVDLYGGKQGAETLAGAEEKWGELPPTWVSTSRTDGSGIRYFRVPEGLKWTDVGAGVETIKWYHRYAIVFPSIHDKTGKRYFWVNPDGESFGEGAGAPGDIEFPSPDELPELPEAWVQGLTGGEQYTGSGSDGDITDDEARDWLAEYGGGDLCDVMQATLTKYSRAVREAGADGGAHDAARNGAWALIGDAGEGHAGCSEALRKLRSKFKVAVAERRGETWRGEWARMVVSGVGKVREELRAAGADVPEEDSCDSYADAGDSSAPRAVGHPNDYTHDDIGNALRLKREVGTDARWSPALNSWVAYDPTTSLWRVDDGNSSMMRRAMQVVRRMEAECEHLADDAKALASYKRFIRSTSTVSKLRSMQELLKDMRGVFVDAAAFDAEETLLQVANGCVVLGDEGSDFRGRRHEDLATFAAPTRYVPGARSDVWDAFLDSIMPLEEDRVWLQTLMGYSLLGRNPERVFVVARGDSGSGKSTFMEAVAKVLGPYAKSYNSSLFREKRDEGPRADILDLLPKRFIYALESSGEQPWHADMLKRATGNDRLRARLLFSNAYVERIPSFTPWLGTNNYPSIPGSDRALQRRIFAAPFRYVALEPDVNLDRKLATVDAQEAILAWAVAGWDLYCRDRLTNVPVGAIRARGEAIASFSLFDQWLDERCEQGPAGEGYRAGAEELRQDWQNWLLDSGHEDSKVTTRQWFAAKMNDHGFSLAVDREKGDGGDRKTRVREGIRLVKVGSLT